MKLPFYVLGRDSSRLFSVVDERGREFLPVFTKPKLLERYKSYFETHHNLQLTSFLVVKIDAAINLLDRVLLSGSQVEFVAVDPKLPDLEDQPVLCHKLMDCIQQLRHSEKLLKLRTDKNGRIPHKKPAE